MKVLIADKFEEPLIEHYSRQPNGSWTYTIQRGLDQKLRIESINCALNSIDVYDRMIFEPKEEEEETEEGEE